MRCQPGQTQGSAASSAWCCATCGTSGTGAQGCITLSSTLSVRLRFGSPFRPGQPSGTLTRIADRFLNRALSAGHLTATGWTAFGPTPLVNRQDLQEAHLWSHFLHASVYVLHSVRCPACQPASQAGCRAGAEACLCAVSDHGALSVEGDQHSRWHSWQHCCQSPFNNEGKAHPAVCCDKRSSAYVEIFLRTPAMSVK